MKKKLFLILLVIHVGINTYSQHSIGFSGGVNYMKLLHLTIQSPPNVYYGEPEESAFGYQLYLTHDYSFKKIKGLHLEGLHLVNYLGYLHKGHKYPRVKLNYLSWSFTPEYYPFENFGIFMGPTINYLCGGTIKFDSHPEVSLSESTNYVAENIESNLNMGISLKYKALNLKFGYSMGLSNYVSIYLGTKTSYIAHWTIESRMYYVSLGLDVFNFGK